MNLKTGDQLTVHEHKTKKSRTIQINQVILKSYQTLSGRLQDRGSYQVNELYIFKSQKNTLFTTVSLNRILKEVFAGDAQNISTHSLRKTFGREVYDSHLQSEYSIMTLSDIFNHSCMSITRRYLGIRQQELNTIYKNLGKRSPVI